MLFNLTSKRLFACKYYESAILCYKENGPFFGDAELKIFAPFNGEENGISCSNKLSYRIPADQK